MNVQEIKFDALRVYHLDLRETQFSSDLSVSNNWLTDEELLVFQAMGSQKRKFEFLAVRFILAQLNYSGCLYYENKVPKLQNGPFISISHSGDWVVVALCSRHPVGVDIERIQEKISRVYHKFVHPEESLCFDSKDLYLSTLLWSFKESVYKLMQIEGLSFSEQICVKTEPSQNFKAHIFTTRGNFEVPLGHHKLGDYVLTFNTADVQKTK
jgi:4'-phosphopantetheinyl transferase EntD